MAPAPLDTAGAIRFAAESRGIDDTFVVANGDVLTDLDIAALVAFHRDRSAEATLHLIGVDDPSSFGVVAVDDRGRVERFVEKPAPGTAPSNLINAGTYVLEPSVVQRIEPDVQVSIERVTFPAIVADQGVFGMATDDYWIDTGRPDFYLRANLDVISGRRPHDVSDAIAPGARIHATGCVENSVVAAGASVGAGAVVRDSVLLDGAVVADNATVRASVVLGRIGASAHVDDCVIGAAGEVDAAEHLAGARRPDPDAP